MRPTHVYSSRLKKAVSTWNQPQSSHKIGFAFFSGVAHLLLLRQHGSGKHRGVGECYFLRIMDDTAFLGPMPSDGRRVMCYSPNAKQYLFTAINEATGEVQV